MKNKKIETKLLKHRNSQYGSNVFGVTFLTMKLNQESLDRLKYNNEKKKSVFFSCK